MLPRKRRYKSINHQVRFSIESFHGQKLRFLEINVRMLYVENNVRYDIRSRFIDTYQNYNLNINLEHEK